MLLSLQLHTHPLQFGARTCSCGPCSRPEIRSLLHLLSVRDYKLNYGQLRSSYCSSSVYSYIGDLCISTLSCHLTLLWACSCTQLVFCSLAFRSEGWMHHCKGLENQLCHRLWGRAKRFFSLLEAPKLACYLISYGANYSQGSFHRCLAYAYQDQSLPLHF